MATVNNGTGVYGTLGFNFSDPNGAVQNFSDDTIKHLNSVPAVITTWQAQDIANNDVGNYTYNPVANAIYAISDTANTLLGYADIRGSTNAITGLFTNILTNCQFLSLSGTTEVSNAETFLFHTSRMSNVRKIDDDVKIGLDTSNVPYYQTATSMCKSATYIVHQTDNLSNNSIMLGCFTSILVANQINQMANTIIYAGAKISNSLSLIPLEINSYYKSILSYDTVLQISKDFSNTVIMFTERENADKSFYANVKSLVTTYNATKAFNNMGETESFLVNNFIGTNKIKKRLGTPISNTVAFVYGGGSGGSSNSSGTITSNKEIVKQIGLNYSGILGDAIADSVGRFTVSITGGVPNSTFLYSTDNYAQSDLIIKNNPNLASYNTSAAYETTSGVLWIGGFIGDQRGDVLGLDYEPSSLSAKGIKIARNYLGLSPRYSNVQLAIGQGLLRAGLKYPDPDFCPGVFEGHLDSKGSAEVRFGSLSSGPPRMQNEGTFIITFENGHQSSVNVKTILIGGTVGTGNTSVSSVPAGSSTSVDATFPITPSGVAATITWWVSTFQGNTFINEYYGGTVTIPAGAESFTITGAGNGSYDLFPGGTVAIILVNSIHQGIGGVNYTVT
jgi:hypothetical protein